MRLNEHSRLKVALDSFANQYMKNKYNILYEADLQVELSKSLQAVFNEPHIVKKELNKGEGLEDVTEFDIGKVHREYPKPLLFDLVVLGSSKQKDEVHTNYGSGYEAFYRQPLKYAIELKFIPLHQSGVSNSDNSWNDYKGLVKNVSLIKGQNNVGLELSFALQITVFQGLAEQKKFLMEHNNEEYIKQRKWENWHKESRELTSSNLDVGYYYLDLESGEFRNIIGA